MATAHISATTVDAPRQHGREGAAAGLAIASRIGILAIQGDFAAHARRMEDLGASPHFIRTPADFKGLDGIILPGGESSTHLKLLEEEGLRQPLVDFARRGGAIFGTCAGAILLAREVRHPSQPSLGLLDIVVSRNAYGRQLSSDVYVITTALHHNPLEMVFIRAPMIESAGPAVSVLASRDGHPVLVQQGAVMAATFHPELSADPAVHRHFLELARSRS